MIKTKKGYAANPKAVQRRTRVINRLEQQLKSGGKPDKRDASDIGEFYLLALTESDIKRINNELTILKSRV